MKNFYLLLFVLTVGFYNAQVTVTWDGGGTTNNFNDANNWSTNAVPTTTNNIVFDGTSSKNCDFNVNVSVLSMSINAGYTGVINGSSAVVTFTGNFSQASGTFISTTDSLTFHNGNITISGGTFNHNNGVVVLRVSANFTSNISGAISFNKLMIASRGATSGSQRVVNFGTATSASHFIINNGTQRFAYLGALAVTSLLDLRGGLSQAGTNTATFTLGGAGNFTMTSITTNLSSNYLPNLVFNTVGNIVMAGGSFFSVIGNWTHVSGTFLPETSTVYFFGNCSIVGSGNAFNSIIVLQSSVLNFPSNSEVKISGNLQIVSTGVVNFPATSILGLNGTGTQNLQWGGATSGAVATFGSLRVYNTTINRRVQLQGAGVSFAIQDSLKIDAGLATEFRTDGKLILRSTPGLKARIATLGTGASVFGNVTVQTIIPGGFTGWANLGVPGIQNQTVQNWDTHLSSGGANGIPMTCTGCSYGPDEILNGPFTSIQGWNESTNSYVNYISTTPLTRGIGHWVYVGNGVANTTDLTLVNTGSLVQGNVTIPITNNSSGYNLIANPYASPIRWSRVLASSTNVANEIHIFNADLGVTTSFVGGVGTHPVSTGASDVIQAGQAFYVLATGAGNVNFQESHKVAFNTGANPLLRPVEAESEEGVFRLKLSDNNGYEDYTVFRTHPQGSLGYDKRYDAHKILQSPGYAGYPGPYTKYTTISSKDNSNEDYSINTLPILTETVSIPVLVRVAISGSHTIAPLGLDNFKSCVYLKDKQTGTLHDLKTGPYSFTISDTVTSPRFELVMCQQRAENPTSIAELLSGEKLFIGQDESGVFVTTHLLQNSKAQISAYNLMGQKVMEDIVVVGEDNLTRLNLNLHKQVVIIKVQTDRETLTKKVLVH